MFWKRAVAPKQPAFIKPDGPSAFRVRVRTQRHGEIVELRFTKSGDISSDEQGYFVRKHIVAPKSFERATLEVRFAKNYSNPQVTVENGEALPISQWE